AGNLDPALTGGLTKIQQRALDRVSQSTIDRQRLRREIRPLESHIQQWLDGFSGCPEKRAGGKLQHQISVEANTRLAKQALHRLEVPAKIQDAAHRREVL